MKWKSSPHGIFRCNKKSGCGNHNYFISWEVLILVRAAQNLNSAVTVDEYQRAEGWVTAEKTLMPCQVRFLCKYQEFNEERIAYRNKNRTCHKAEDSLWGFLLWKGYLCVLALAHVLNFLSEFVQENHPTDTGPVHEEHKEEITNNYASHKLNIIPCWHLRLPDNYTQQEVLISMLFCMSGVSISMLIVQNKRNKGKMKIKTDALAWSLLSGSCWDWNMFNKYVGQIESSFASWEIYIIPIIQNIF